MGRPARHGALPRRALGEHRILLRRSFPLLDADRWIGGRGGPRPLPSAVESLGPDRHATRRGARLHDRSSRHAPRARHGAEPRGGDVDGAFSGRAGRWFDGPAAGAVGASHVGHRCGGGHWAIGSGAVLHQQCTIPGDPDMLALCLARRASSGGRQGIGSGWRTGLGPGLAWWRSAGRTADCRGRPVRVSCPWRASACGMAAALCGPRGRAHRGRR